MPIYKFEAFQFLSRKTVDESRLDAITTSPKERTDLRFRIDVRIEPKSFDLNFCQLKAVGPSIGAHQFIDSTVDTFLARRWPMCVSARGEVEIPDGTLNAELKKILIYYPRAVLWSLREPIGHAVPSDQRAYELGYRREGVAQQRFDIVGSRRPSGRATYVPTSIEEPIGPGVVTFREWDDENELFWSPVLPFRNRRTFDEDKEDIKRSLSALWKHYNSNAEFEDALRYQAADDFKASVRSAASAVDAILGYYRDAWDLKKPAANLTFDAKIDDLLKRAGRPTYRSINPGGSDDLLNLYRCRNSMHDGDCYYNDQNGVRIDVRSTAIVRQWVKAVEEFIIWIDSLA